MSFWVRNDSGARYTIDDLGLTLETAEERDLHLSNVYEVLHMSANLASALSSADVVKLDGPGGSTVPADDAFDDAVAEHAIDSDAHTGNLDTDAVTEAGNLYYTEGRVSANTDVASNSGHRVSEDNPHDTTIDNLGNGTLLQLNTIVTDATLDDTSTARPPLDHVSEHEDGGHDVLDVSDLSGLLSDPQTPLDHAATHEDSGGDVIDVSGLSGLLADPQTPTKHVASHQNGGADELNVAGLHGVLADAQTPSTHATAHESGGADEIDHQDLNGAGTTTHAQLDSHVGATDNPHSVTPAQVGNGTAQWNADEIQGRPVDSTDPSVGEYLVWGGSDWSPSGIDVGAEYCDCYDAAGGTSLSGTWADVPVATERKKTSAFTHSGTSPEEVEIATAGTYVVIGRVSTEQTAINSRSEAEMQLVLDTGSGYTALPGSLAKMYSRQITQGAATGMAVAVIDFAVGHKIKLQARRASGTGTLATLDEGSSLVLFSTQGPQGVKGDTGSGSTLTIQDEGTNVPNTPHSALDFVGDGVEVTDVGSGVAEVNVVGASAVIFGSEFAHNESLAQSTATGTTWVEKVRLDVTNIVAGTYRVGWSFEWGHSSAAADFRGRVQVDDSTILLAQQSEPKDTGTDQHYPSGGFGNITLTSGDHHVDLDFSSSSTNTARIWNARLEFWRVS